MEKKCKAVFASVLFCACVDCYQRSEIEAHGMLRGSTIALSSASEDDVTMNAINMHRALSGIEAPCLSHVLQRCMDQIRTITDTQTHDDYLYTLNVLCSNVESVRDLINQLLKGKEDSVLCEKNDYNIMSEATDFFSLKVHTNVLEIALHELDTVMPQLYAPFTLDVIDKFDDSPVGFVLELDLTTKCKTVEDFEKINKECLNLDNMLALFINKYKDDNCLIDKDILEDAIYDIKGAMIHKFAGNAEKMQERLQDNGAGEVSEFLDAVLQFCDTSRKIKNINAKLISFEKLEKFITDCIEKNVVNGRFGCFTVEQLIQYQSTVKNLSENIPEYETETSVVEE